MQNHFEIFEIPVSYEVELTELEQKYFRLQMQFHPDRAIGKSDVEQMLIIGKSADLNEGFKILKDDVLRAQYILSLKGVVVNREKDNTYKPTQSLLMEQLELREQVAEAGSDFIPQMEKLIAETKDNFVKTYSEEDFEGAANATMRLKYLDKLISEVRKG